MKTVFEGQVNGAKFNTVEEYNNALVQALKSGMSGVEASSRTYTVEEPLEPVTKFHGIVNGEEFFTVEEYNEAVQKVLNAGEPLDACTRTVSGEFNENECADDKENDYDFDWFPGLDDDNEDEDEYYMNTVTPDRESNQAIINDWNEYLKYLAGSVHDALVELTDDDLQAYLEDLEDALEQIKGDAEANSLMLDKKQIALTAIENKIEQVGTLIDMLGEDAQTQIDIKLKSLKEDIVLFEDCGRLNTMFNQYYTYLIGVVKDSIGARKQAMHDAEQAYTDTKVDDEGIKKLLNELFPKRSLS